MATNTMRYEESSEIVLDTEALAFAAGWTPGNYVSVQRVGGLVAVHIEAGFGIAAAGLVGTLPPDFQPGDTVLTTGFSIAASGAITYSGSTSAAGTAICAATFQAGDLS